MQSLSQIHTSFDTSAPICLLKLNPTHLIHLICCCFDELRVPELVQIAEYNLDNCLVANQAVLCDLESQLDSG